MSKTLTQITHRLHYGWIVLIIGTLVVFGALGLARFGYTVGLPSMQVSLGMDNTQAGVLLTGMVNAFLPAALWRALTGIGSGASNVPVMALLSAWFASRRRGLATGIAATGSSIGLIVVGPMVPRILTAYAERGWRVSWLLFGTTTLFIALLAWSLLRDRSEDLGLEALGETKGGQKPVPRARPLEWGRVYRAPEVWHLGLVYVAFGFSYIIYLTFFTKFLVFEGSYTQSRAGTLFMTMGWFSLLCGLVWGAVSDVIGRKRTLTIVYLIHAMAFSMFGLWKTPAGFTVSAILFGITAWSIPAIMAATCGDVLGPRLAPAALGFITLFFGIGQAIGPSVAGAMADASGTFVSAYLLAAFVAVLGAFGSLRLRPASTTMQTVAQPLDASQQT